MIIGAHAIIYSKDPDADRGFLRDVLEFPHVDVGEGWLIFGLPPAEVAVHPADDNDLHELYLMCDDVAGLVSELRARGTECGPLQQQGWGLLTHITLPGGGKLGVYQPRHARPKPMTAKARGRKTKRTRSAGAKARAVPRTKATAKARTKATTRKKPASARRR